MDSIMSVPNKYKFLLCRDVDGNSAQKMAELFVPKSPHFDAVLLCGPFIHDPIVSKENETVAEGEVASIIAQFENIVCRVVYLPASTDPPATLIEQLNLTPNSVNIHARQLNLTDSLSIVGFTERGNTAAVDTKALAERDEDEHDTEDVNVKSGLSISIIQELLENAVHQNEGNVTRMFALNYSFSHTLNQFLFHLSTELNEAHVNLCIISSDNQETERLPTKFGNLSIAALKSLRKEGAYSVVDIERNETTQSWDVVSIVTHKLTDN